MKSRAASRGLALLGLPASGRHHLRGATNKKPRPRPGLFITTGAGNRNRTYDLRITNAPLYQLSYSGLAGHCSSCRGLWSIAQRRRSKVWQLPARTGLRSSCLLHPPGPDQRVTRTPDTDCSSSSPSSGPQGTTICEGASCQIASVDRSVDREAHYPAACDLSSLPQPDLLSDSQLRKSQFTIEKSDRHFVVFPKLKAAAIQNNSAIKRLIVDKKKTGIKDSLNRRVAPSFLDRKKTHANNGIQLHFLQPRRWRCRVIHHTREQAWESFIGNDKSWNPTIHRRYRKPLKEATTTSVLTIV